MYSNLLRDDLTWNLLDQSSRVDRFSRTIAEAQKQAEEKLMRELPWDEWWKVIRSSVVKPVLQDAATALTRAGYTSELMPLNGTGWLLQVGPEDAASNHHLTFRLRGESVVISSSEFQFSDVWETRQHFTAENVEKKANEFIYRIAGKTDGEER